MSGVDSDLAALKHAPLTYPEVGGSLEDQMPAGYVHLRRSLTLGAGEALFGAVAARLFRWEAQRGAGLAVRASGPASAVGSVAVVTLGRRPLAMTAPVRVVATVDDPLARGFAYGTLPGHPETGEESFVVELGGDGMVVATVTAFSRPSSWPARLGGPITRAGQRVIADRYLRALR